MTGTSGSVSLDEFFRVIGSSQPETIDFDPAKMNLKDAVQQFEGRIVQRTVRQLGSTYKAAEALGISQPSVVRKTKILVLP